MTEAPTEKYAKQRRHTAKKAVLQSNIAPLPKVVDPERRKACEKDLKLALETYWAAAFPLAWSPGHLEVIESLQFQIENGGSKAIAMPRGSGKTTLIVRAAMWAVLCGHVRYAFIIAADATKAQKLLAGVKKELRFNELLFEDFPEVCHPVRCLQGLAINAGKQHLDGEYTQIDWRQSTAQLPTIEGSPSSGSIIEVAGVTSAARGAQTVLDTGEIIRPELVLIDDFQTRESAASPLQSKTRLDILAGDLAGMKGPDQKLAMLAAVTVIYPDDAADQLINRDICPEWAGVRQQMVESWPDREDLWEQYAEMRLAAKRREDEPVDADKFYLEHQEEMDRGAAVSWPERKEGDHSAIQHAFNLRLRIGEEAFLAEYQNTPEDPNAAAVAFLGPEEIAAKTSGLAPGVLPAGTEKIVAAIDVQTNHLWYAVTAWTGDFSGTTLEYGTYPKQSRRFFTKRKLPKTFDDVEAYAGKSEEAQILAATKDLLAHLAGKTWTDADGAVHAISRGLIDEGYQADVVHQAISTSPHGSLWAPAKGHGIDATATPMRDWTVKKGDPRPKHDFWRRRLGTGKGRRVRTIHWDTNYWGVFLHRRLQADHGDPGCFAFPGDNPVAHRLVAAHLTAKTPELRVHGSIEVIRLNEKPAKPDDDLGDVLGMCCVAASEQGVELVKKKAPRSKKESKDGRLSLKDYMKKRRKA